MSAKTAKKVQQPVKEIVVARIRKGTRQKEMTVEHIDLFFPGTTANFGHLWCWSSQGGGGGEASMEYYHETRKPKTEKELELVKQSVAECVAIYQTPVEPPWIADMRVRLPVNYREMAGWYR